MIKTLRVKISLYLTVAVCTVSLASIWISSVKIQHEIGELYDKQLIYIAETLASGRLSSIDSNGLTIDPNILSKSQSSTKEEINFGGYGIGKLNVEEEALSLAIFDQHGKRLFVDNDYGYQLKFQPIQGFTAVTLNDGEQWRFYWYYTKKNNGVFIAVGQQLKFRNQVSKDMMWSQTWLWFLSLPILWGLMIGIIYYELNYFKKLNVEINNLNPNYHSRLLVDKTSPTEVQPLINSLNHYFIKSEDLINRERRLVSDAAHEIKTPLTGLRVQAEIAMMHDNNPKERNKHLNNLIVGIDRTTNLLNQLLTLSRLDCLSQLDDLVHIDWEKLILNIFAERKQINNTVNHKIEFKLTKLAEPKQKLGQLDLIGSLICNLVDNSIKYSSQDIIIEAILDSDEIKIVDTGTGVSDEHLPNLGQRFYRPAGQNEKGSGLGLSIVFTIAALHGFTVTIDHNKPQGLMTTIKL